MVEEIELWYAVEHWLTLGERWWWSGSRYPTREEAEVMADKANHETRIVLYTLNREIL